MKFKIVYVIVLLVIQNAFIFGQKEVVITKDSTGVPTFDITDPLMVFSKGLSVPEIGMDAHNKNGYNEIYLQDLSNKMSEILGQLSIKDHAVTSLTIINPNGIFVNGGSFLGAEKITLSALGRGDVWFNPSRVVLEKSTAMPKKPEVHVQDLNVFGVWTQKTGTASVAISKDKIPTSWAWTFSYIIVRETTARKEVFLKKNFYSFIPKRFWRENMVVTKVTTEHTK